MTRNPWMVVGDLAWAAIVGAMVGTRYYGLAAFLAMDLLLLRIHDCGRK
jgi:hypothetical protein